MDSALTTSGLLVITVFTFASAASAQRPGGQPPLALDDDHAVVFELGAVADWEHAEHAVHTGGTLAFEVTPIEHWLELEVGVSAIMADGALDVPIDVLFKKPWRFSPQIEFMVGVGPEIVHASGPNHATYWGVEAVLDFMYWPRKHIGWYVEPGYEVTFRDGTSHNGLSVSGGLLIGR